MKKYVCNPMNLSYKYQFCQQLLIKIQDRKIIGREKGKETVVREAADPSLVAFKGRYYLFPSMSKGFWVSDDLADWQYVPLKNTPHNDYAPDVCVVGDYLYFCASKRGEVCPFYRTKDPMSGEFEEITGTFDFWDPDLFADDDGKLYFYWGCTNRDPIYGVELDSETMQQKSEVFPMLAGEPQQHGFERIGENHILPELPPDATEMEKMIRLHCGTGPYIEGAWMTKCNGKYYLQYAAPGTEYNVYGDGVYISEDPLKGFTYAKNNPYSYKPSGFIAGAGHGSTMQDKFGNWWHVSTMRVSCGNHFERRLGMFLAGFDEEGELFCNQRYGDWPFAVENKKIDPWAEPEIYLLSYQKGVRASSSAQNCPPENAVNENIRDWWKAATDKPGEWIEVDLGKEYSVRAVQINFADDNLQVPLPEGAERIAKQTEARYIERGENLYTRWILEGSTDGIHYVTLCDKRNADTDLPHDFIAVNADLRYIRLTVTELPFAQAAAVSGLRIFGFGTGDLPMQSEIQSAKRIGDLDAEISWSGDAVGYAVLWGYAPNKLYHSHTVYRNCAVHIGALNKGQPAWVRVDSFNENGITHGTVQEIKE